MKSPVAVLLMMSAAAAVSVGCGNDDSASKAPTKEAYIEQADAVCREGNQALEDDAATFFASRPDPTPADEQQYGMKVFVPNIEGQLAKLRALQTPTGDEAEVKAIWDAATAGLDELKSDPASFGGEPPRDFEKTSRLARGYGFKVCGGT